MKFFKFKFRMHVYDYKSHSIKINQDVDLGTVVSGMRLVCW